MLIIFGVTLLLDGMCVPSLLFDLYVGIAVWQQDLPAPTPVSCGIPNEAFGDAVLLLEYLLCFQSFLEFNLPENISLGMYEVLC